MWKPVLSAANRAFDFHATEAPDVDAAVGAAAPWASPLLQLGHFRRAVMNKIVDDILLAQPVASRDGVVKMVLKAIVIRATAADPLLQRPYGCASDRL